MYVIPQQRYIQDLALPLHTFTNYLGILEYNIGSVRKKSIQKYHKIDLEL